MGDDLLEKLLLTAREVAHMLSVPKRPSKHGERLEEDRHSCGLLGPAEAFGTNSTH